ncbi:MAG: hypothetical protein LBO72_01845 [Helicobacteraceae bacterium]|nr:hypothetical protein [Helicobacteraceae bacterium]
MIGYPFELSFFSVALTLTVFWLIWKKAERGTLSAFHWLVFAAVFAFGLCAQLFFDLLGS